MRTSLGAVVVCAGLSSSASGQCVAGWDRTIGTPGLDGGYAEPVGSFDDGAGAELYVGGSFTSAGGNVEAAYLARWDEATNTWSAVGGGIQPHFETFMTSIVTADLGAGPAMYVGGAFGSAGNVPDTRSIAAYKNGAWSSLGTGWPLNTGESVWSMRPWNDGTGMKLFVGGGFAAVGGVQANGIAAFDGSQWHALGAGLTGPISPVIFALEVFDDGSGAKLYASGRAASIGGILGMIARWDGTAWSSVGTGLSAGLTSGLEAMAVFDDGGGPALYVGGNEFTPPGQTACVVAKWDGSTWTSVGQNTTGKASSLAVFDDGSGPALYMGGSSLLVGRFAKLVGNTWVTVDGGADSFVFGLNVVGDTLYVAGNFTAVGGGASARIAARTSCGPACYANCDGSTTEPALNVADFTCFLQAFGQGSAYANCDHSTTEPALNVADFTCFLQEFAAGCP